MNVMKYMHQNRGYHEHSDIDLYILFSKMLFMLLFSPLTAYHGRTGLNMKANANYFWHVLTYAEI